MIKMKIFFLNILHDMRLEPTISILTAIRSIQGLSGTVLDMGLENTSLCNQFANLKLVLRRYTSLCGIFMSASLTLFIYISSGKVRVVATDKRNKSRRGRSRRGRKLCGTRTKATVFISTCHLILLLLVFPVKVLFIVVLYSL